jgi:hypothetical protein
MIMKVFKLVLGLILFWAVGSAHATMRVIQKKVSVSRSLAGHVRVRGTEAPASGVRVDLCSPEWKTVLASTMTDEKGYFALQKPAAGTLFYIRLSAPGMDIYELRVRIEKQATPELTIRLSVAT